MSIREGLRGLVDKLLPPMRASIVSLQPALTLDGRQNAGTIRPSDPPWEGMHDDGSEYDAGDPIVQTSWLGFQFFQQRLSDRIPLAMADVIAQYRSWVYVCANRNANTVASIPWHLYAAKKKGKRLVVEGKSLSMHRKAWLKNHQVYGKAFAPSDVEPVEIVEHPFIDLMREGNETSWAGYDMMQLTAMCLDLVGNALWYTPSDALGIPARIFVMLPHLCWVIPNFATGDPMLYGTAGSTFRSEDVVHFACASPLSTWQGFGPGCASWFTMRKLENVEEFEKALQTNGVYPSGILSPEQPMTTEQAGKMNDWFNANHKGVRKAGKLAMPPFPVKLVAAPVPIEAIKFLADHGVSKKEICNIFDTPESMVDLSQTAANAYEGRRQYREVAILPRCNRIESFTNRRVINRYQSNHALFFAFDNPVPQDREEQMSWFNAAASQRVMTRGEAKAVVNKLGNLGVELQAANNDDEIIGGFAPAQSKKPATDVAPTGKEN